MAGLHIIADQLFRDVVDDSPSEGEADRALPPKAREAVARLRGESLHRRLAARLLANQLNNLAESKSRRRWVEHWVEAQGRWSDQPFGHRLPDALDLARVRQVDTMLAAAYLQLAQIVAQESALRQCPGCRGLFFPRRTNQHYCTARCGDAARQRTYYRRRKDGTKLTRQRGRASRRARS